jgi:hypothetical protein
MGAVLPHDMGLLRALDHVASNTRPALPRGKAPAPANALFTVAALLLWHGVGITAQFTFPSPPPEPVVGPARCCSPR